MSILVGADPEIFAFHNGRPVSAYNMIPGSKENPWAVMDGAVQVDGMALEFNINPASSPEQFIMHLNSVMRQLREMTPGFDLIPTPVAEFGEEYIRQQPREATALGCNPDFNAWRGGYVNEPPNGSLPFRTGAGHVHVGWIESNNADILSDEHNDACCDVIKQLDFFLGLPSLLFDEGAKRRMMYGQPGCFRPKTYGAEYRVLSNSWLKDDELKAWVFRNTVSGVERVLSGDKVFEQVDTSLLEYMMAEHPDLDKIVKMCDSFKIELPRAA